MQDSVINNLSVVKYGILFSLLTLLYGFGLGGVFGIFEDNIKGHLKNEAQQVLATAYNGDEVTMKKTTTKSWVYFKRAHLHANGLGTASLALILLIAFLSVSNRVKSINAIFLGIGSLGYSMFWMFAGLRAPAMGSTGLAKESLQWLAMPSSGLCIIGLIMAIGLVITSLFLKNEDR